MTYQSDIVAGAAPLFRKADWCVTDAARAEALPLIEEHHYARGASNTDCYLHGLYRRADGELCGVAWWLPPTKVAAESVNKDHWQRVLGLSRLAIVPGVPTNAASFLLARSTRLVSNDGRFISLVTYADESQGHTGQIYRAANWEYKGKSRRYQRWVDAEGRQVSQKSTVNRTNAQMEALGYRKAGRHAKHKFVLHLHQRREPLLRGVCY